MATDTNRRSFKEKAKERLGLANFRLKGRSASAEVKLPNKDGGESSPGGEAGLVIAAHGHGHMNPLSWDNLPQVIRDKIEGSNDQTNPQTDANGENSDKTEKSEDAVTKMFRPMPVTPVEYVNTMPQPTSPRKEDRDSCKMKRRSRHVVQPRGTIPYTVSERDTLTSIAAQYDTTPSELKTLNKLITTLIFPGQILYMPDKDYIPSPVPTPPQSPATEDKGGGSGPGSQPGSQPTSQPGTPSWSSVRMAPPRPPPTRIQRWSLGTIREIATSAIESFMLDLDIPLVRQVDRSKLPGHAERQKVEEDAKDDTPPRPLSDDDARRLDQECHERFIKVNVKHITDGQGVVSGVLLVTPNAIMFDPNVSDPLVIEHGADAYGMIAPMETIISAAMYHDIAAMKLKGMPKEENAEGSHHEVYHSKDCPMYQRPRPIVPEPQTLEEQKDPEPIQEETQEEIQEETQEEETKVEEELDSRTPEDSEKNKEFLKFRRDSTCSCGAELMSPEESKVKFGTDHILEESCSQELESSVDQGLTFTAPPVHEDKDEEDVKDRSVGSRGVGTDAATADAAMGDTATADAVPVQDPDLSSAVGQVLAGTPPTNIRPELEGLDFSSLGGSVCDTGPKESELTDTMSNLSLSNTGTHGGSEPAETASDRTTQGDVVARATGEGEQKTADENEMGKEGEVGKSSSPLATSQKQIGNIMYFQYGKETTGTETTPGASLGDGENQAPPLDVDNNDNNKVEPGSDANGNLSPSIAVPRSGEPTTPSQTGILSRTIGSLTSLGSSIASSSPNFSSIVDFSSGLFTRNQEERGRVKDVSEVTMATPPVRTSWGFSEELVEDESLDVLVSEGVIIDRAEPSPVVPDEPVKGHVNIEMENAVKLDEKAGMFKSLDELIPKPARLYEDPPLYLCLKVGRPINKRVSQTCPIESYMKKKTKPEYWFSIPRDKVDHLYAFFVQWSPNIYGGEDEIDPTERGFVVINDSEEEDEGEENMDVIEDHFKQERRLMRQMTKDWEIVNLEEARRRMSMVEDEMIGLPDFSDPSTIMSEEHFKKLMKNLPARAEGYPWQLQYSSDKHGFSLKTLYRSMAYIDSPVLLVLKDTNNQIFGAMLSCPPKMSEHFYGTGESFLFTFYPEFKKFAWTGHNNFFIKGNADCLGIGAGEGLFGLWLDGDIYHGRTQTCQTFENRLLTEAEDFVVKGLEAWVFV